MTNPDIIIYTDGSSRGNPGPGGYGIVMQKYGTNYIKEFSEGFRKTTNNRMELLAVIVALEKLKKSNQKVHVYTDSKYVSESVEKKWVNRWEKKGFKSKKNPDLWIRFLKIFRKHEVHFFWIKGHNNNLGNERCDELAFNASLKQKLLIDAEYESKK
jgi:Ribonuclease HI